jgi:hypothetical protein
MNAYYKFSILALFAAYFVGSLANAGKLYSWVDENGQVQYSDRQPIGSSYTEKYIRPGSRANSAAVQDGLRHGEQELLRKSNRRKSDLLSSRRTSLRKYDASKKRCSQLTGRYYATLGEPGADNREKIKDIYKRMKSACR